MKKKSQLEIANAKKRICGNPRTESYSVRDSPEIVPGWLLTTWLTDKKDYELDVFNPD